ncbi:hypothetical protein [Devosia sp.]|uniref:hypothetical protein n=1 Tax=Devosia sp. TaxID=1871048 RepID=UPI0019FE94C6|nr:hypothetical protein [Devosia sp.]MBE0577836.1 hypothetical protein [Devosia sp.]
MATLDIPKNVLASWASQQAILHSATKAEKEDKGDVAEIVLKYGGDTFDLPIVNWRRRWFSAKQFYDEISKSKGPLVLFDGNIYFDDEEDDMSRAVFETYFEFDRSIIRTPDVGAGYNKTSHCAYLAMAVAKRAWPTCRIASDQRRVGTADGVAVERVVRVLSRH